VGLDIATWVIVIVALLAFLAAFGEFVDAPPGSGRRQMGLIDELEGHVFLPFCASVERLTLAHSLRFEST
jgi:hypothetical protein